MDGTAEILRGWKSRFLIWEFQIWNSQLSLRQRLLHSKSSRENYCPNSPTENVCRQRGGKDHKILGRISTPTPGRHNVGPSEDPTGTLWVEELSKGSPHRGQVVAGWLCGDCRQPNQGGLSALPVWYGTQPNLPCVQEQSRNDHVKDKSEKALQMEGENTASIFADRSPGGWWECGRGQRHEAAVTSDQISSPRIPSGLRCWVNGD